jgi:hypothetical protein
VPARFQVEDAFFEGGQPDVVVGLVAFERVHAGEVATCELLEAGEDLGLEVAREFLGAFLGCLDFGRELGFDSGDIGFEFGFDSGDFGVYDHAYLFEVFLRHWLAFPGGCLDYT